MKITSGIIHSAQKIVVYGPEGIGKSTFASNFPDPLFSDTEGSTKKLDVKRFDAPSSWQMLLEQVKYVKDAKPCSTYVIDTLDWAEILCVNFVCARAKKNSIEEFGYGKGYTYLAEEFGKLLNLLTDVIDSGINVVLLAHAKMRKFEQPDELGAYDRWEMKLTRQVAPLVSEWADTILFANYKTYIVKSDSDKNKVQGGYRVMYTTHHPCWDAKNRDGLADELPLDFEQIRHIIPCSVNTAASSVDKKVEKINQMIEHTDFEEVAAPDNDIEDGSLQSDNPKIQSLYDLMNEHKVTVSEIQEVVAQKGYYPRGTPLENYDPEFITGVLVGAWPQVFDMIQKQKTDTDDDIPF